MGGMSIWHWIIVGGVLLVLFGGKGKISDLMGDFAKGVKSFKKGLADDEEPADRKPVAPVASVGAEPVKSIDHRSNLAVDDPAEQRRAG
jgi:sec-independent protein translocase protein TatA